MSLVDMDAKYLRKARHEVESSLQGWQRAATHTQGGPGMGVTVGPLLWKRRRLYFGFDSCRSPAQSFCSHALWRRLHLLEHEHLRDYPLTVQ